MRAWLVVVFVCGCGARTGLAGDVSTDAALDRQTTDAEIEAGSDDAPVDVALDVSVDVPGPDASPVCDFGTVVADPFGTATFWNGGAPLPAGHYRVTYVDGCLKYASAQGWSVNAYADGPDTLYVVDNQGTPIAPAPGTVGFLEGQGGFASFDDCVTTNLADDASLEFDYGGGVLGVKLSDSPYTDNIAGENGRNPTYHLSSCP